MLAKNATEQNRVCNHTRSWVASILLVGFLNLPSPYVGQAAAQEDFLYYENFDGDITDDVGLQFRRYEGNGTYDLSGGDFDASSPDGWTMWWMIRFDGKTIERRDEWSYRARVTVDSALIVPIGTQVYNHAGLYDPEFDHEYVLRAGAGGGGGTAWVEVPYEVEGEELLLQMDAFGGEITASLWRDGDPDSLIQQTHPYDPVRVFPSFGVHTGSATFHEMWLAPSPLPICFVAGDFNLDCLADAADVDLLTFAMNVGDPDPQFDLNGDGAVDFADRTVWVHDLNQTWFGDANLDGEFTSLDFVVVFQTDKFETGQNAGWSEGDWNGDGIFSTSDFVTAFQDSGYEMGPRLAQAMAVPEPSSGLLALAAVVLSFMAVPRRVALLSD